MSKESSLSVFPTSDWEMSEAGRERKGASDPTQRLCKGSRFGSLDGGWNSAPSNRWCRMHLFFYNAGIFVQPWEGARGGAAHPRHTLRQLSTCSSLGSKRPSRPEHRQHPGGRTLWAAHPRPHLPAASSRVPVLSLRLRRGMLGHVLKLV